MKGHIRNQEQWLPLRGRTKAGWEDISFTTKYNIQFITLKLYTLPYFFKSLKCKM